MKRLEMLDLLDEELRQMPRGSFAQNEFRMVYAIERQHDLSRDRTCPAASSFGRALASVQGRNPGFAPIVSDPGSWS
jgi:hypothetical protein